MWKPPPENLLNIRPHCSVSHQTHLHGGVEKMSVGAHDTEVYDKLPSEPRERALVCPVLQVTIVDEV